MANPILKGMDYQKLLTVFNRKTGWNDFFAEALDQRSRLGGNDTDFNSFYNEMRNTFNGFGSGSSSSGIGGSIKQSLFGGGGYLNFGGDRVFDGTSNFIIDAVNKSQKGGGNGQGEFGSIEKLLGFVLDRGGLKNVSGIWEHFKTVLKDEVLIYLEQQTQLYETINEQIGMSGELAGVFRDELMLASPDVIKWGVTFNEMSTSVGSLVRESGKFKLLSSDTIEEMALASKFTESMTDFVSMAPNFERVGLGIKDMSLLVEKMGLKSMTLGLNARETTSLVNTNLKQLNAYGFKDGVEGLNRMAQKAIEFRMNMDSVFTLAEKVWDPDKALDLVANLQIIGGAFGDLNDPIKLMYMATNNVEGLQDALIGAAKSLATYNSEQGRFEVIGVNLRRAKAYAEALGMSTQEVSQLAIAEMERAQAASELYKFNIPDEDKEFLTNLSQMKDGKMVIEIPQKLRDQLGIDDEQAQIAISDMKEDQVKFLLSQKEALEKMSMEEVAREQVSLMTNIEREVSRIRAYMRVNVGQEIADVLDKSLGVNQAKLSEDVSNLGNKVITNLGNAKDSFQQVVAEYFPQIQNGQIATEATSPNSVNNNQRVVMGTTSPPPVNSKTTTEVNVNIKTGDAYLDSLRRTLLNDPFLMEEYKKSFLNPN